ncbi:MAG: SRPBCC domain-containing protein [Actinomycetota bacterium]
MERDSDANPARASTTVNAPAADVWHALVDPKAIKEYMFGANVTSEWTPGSSIVWEGEMDGKAFRDHGTILRVDSEHVLQYSHFSPLSGMPDAPENYHTVTISLEPAGDGTLVSLSQDNVGSDEERTQSEGTWMAMLTGLKTYVEAAS